MFWLPFTNCYLLIKKYPVYSVNTSTWGNSTLYTPQIRARETGHDPIKSLNSLLSTSNESSNTKMMKWSGTEGASSEGTQTEEKHNHFIEEKESWKWLSFKQDLQHRSDKLCHPCMPFQRAELAIKEHILYWEATASGEQGFFWENCRIFVSGRKGFIVCTAHTQCWLACSTGSTKTNWKKLFSI